ncbi:tyrosine-type recombinase/integrase [Nocardia sp. NPDC101769]|uniref:tyrosine-type recombinase/integrase n=1 Tax=Nocardia sp. NPDC101769 TaxID=3364333 RepID=UPI00382EAADA
MIEPHADPARRAAELSLASNVRHLDPESAVYTAMISGWADQQRARFLAQDTVQQRIALVRRFSDFSGLYPWQWTVAEVEAWFASLVSGPCPRAFTTIRGYQLALRMFCDYLTDQRYGWVALCLERFGQAPTQILHEWNTVSHVSEFEGNPRRRALTYDEVQDLFDAADGQVEKIRGRGRKGAVPALRDAVLLKTVYAFGLRRREAAGLDLADLRVNPKMPDYGRIGGVFVRFGKSARGGPPKRRTVLTVPEMDWIVDIVDHYLEEVRPCFGAGAHPALWTTERCGRMTVRGVNEAFSGARDAAGLAPELDLHCLRHSYITHLIEFGYPEKFVQDQVGHAYASTTAIYTHVSDEYRSRLVREALAKRNLWEEAPK